MLEKIKRALRLTTEIYDDELLDMLESARADLGLVGIPYTVISHSPLAEMAIITYCRVHFGAPENYEQLKRSYDEQKAQLMTGTICGAQN